MFEVWVILGGNTNEKRGVLVLPALNTPLPSVKSWLADRLALLYHKTGLVLSSWNVKRSLSNSCKKSKGVGLCLPQTYPILMLCWLQPAKPHALMSFLMRQSIACHFSKPGGMSNDRERTGNLL